MCRPLFCIRSANLGNSYLMGGLNFVDELYCWNWRLSQTKPSNLSTLPILTIPNAVALIDSRPLGMKYAFMFSIWGPNFADEHCCYELQSGWLWAVFDASTHIYLSGFPFTWRAFAPTKKEGWFSCNTVTVFRWIQTVFFFFSELWLLWMQNTQGMIQRSAWRLPIWFMADICYKSGGL